MPTFRSLSPTVARRLAAIRRDARPLPRPRAATVPIPVESMAAIVFGRGAA